MTSGNSEIRPVSSTPSGEAACWLEGDDEIFTAPEVESNVGAEDAIPGGCADRGATQTAGTMDHPNSDGEPGREGLRAAVSAVLGALKPAAGPDDVEPTRSREFAGYLVELVEREFLAHGWRPPLRGSADKRIAAEVVAERVRQHAKWGEQNHPDIWPDGPTGLREWYANRANDWKRDNAHRVECGAVAGTPKDRNAAWDGILLEEVFEALAEADPAKLRAELIQVAAVAVAWVGALDRRAVQS